MCFAARWLAGEPKLNEELDDARWLEPAELAGLKTTDGLAEIVAAPSSGSKACKSLPCSCPDAGHIMPVKGQPREKARHCRIDPALPRRPARADDTPAPFDNDLQRLAEILGALHYLRAVCGANEGQKWRDQMQSLIDAETPDGDRRRKIVASFNRGYRGFQQTYRTCTPAADLAIRRYLEEGAKISREITARYAN